MKKSILQYFWTGILAFWVPLILIAYSVKLIWPVIEKMSKPIARLLPFHSIAGEILDFIVGVIIVLLVTLLIGWVVRKTVLNTWVQQIDKLLARLFPNYSFYRNYLSDAAVDEQKGWESVLFQDDEADKLGFVVDEKDGVCTVYVPAVPNPYEGEMIFRKRPELQPVNISFAQAIGMIRRYGKGFSEVKDLEKKVS